MFYIFNFKNLLILKPINKFSLRIFKFNILIWVYNIILTLLFNLFIILFLILYRRFLKFNQIKSIKYKFKIYINFINIFIILNFLILSTKLLFKYEKNINSFITVKVIGYQWRWYYYYISGLGCGINYFSNLFTNLYEIFNFTFKKKNYLQEVDNNFIIPVNKIIRLIFTSSDVIHSWYIPSLSIKQDSIPGFYRDIYFKSSNIGKYKGFCTELCGKNHSFMPIVINILSIKNYKKWILSFLYKKFLLFNF